jgi:Uncharacterized protein conserved in bacteria (DUF2188)
MTVTAMTVFRVLPPMLDQWELYRGSRQIGRFEDKSSAVAEGRRLARESAPSRLFVYTANGEIENEVTFPGDAVPHPG